MAPRREKFDYLVVGGGFYGCCLALFLRTISSRVALIEAEDRLMSRASRVNQARIHTGFHYPRSALTAVKSLLLHRQFMRDFPEAVVDTFEMIYAISRRHSKVTAKRFYRMFRDAGAPIEHASAAKAALFDPDAVEGVYTVREAAFNYAVLEQLLTSRLRTAGVEVRLSTTLVALSDRGRRVIAELGNGTEIAARYAFNVTYSDINSILQKARLPIAPLKFELAEIALIIPPPELNGVAVTVMDGPFFSCMPYPAENLYSLTHVRYTPHASWTAESGRTNLTNAAPDTRFAYMIRDGERLLPCLAKAKHVKSIFGVKAVLKKNEQDDGRPILYQKSPSESRVISILGGKLDNIYDLFGLLKKTDPEFATAHDRLVRGIGS